MKISRILSFCSLFIILSCSKDDKKSEEIPECLKHYIENILSRSTSAPNGRIDKYIYNGREVYVTSNDIIIPDLGASVIGSDCEPLCELGGFDGDQNDCPNFEDAEFIETVWTDPR